jgi:TolB-like protein
MVALLQLMLLGGFTAQMSAQQMIKVSGRRNQALLAFLAVNPGRRHPREKLVELFWGDRDQDRGRNSLRQALTALRKDLTGLDPSPVAIDGEVLSIAAGAVEVDTVTFERLAQSNEAEALKQAAALYRGDLLAGLTLEEAGFEGWLNPERARLRELAVDVHTRLVPLLSGAEAVDTARRLVALDPLRENSQRLLIRLLAERGETEIALKEYRAFSARLERELGLKPSAAIQSLQKEISSGRYRQEQAAASTSAANAALAAFEQRIAEKLLIAVLPFENRSLDPEHRFFCDGLAGEIADALARVTGFLVTARSATANYRGSAVDIRRVGAELGAAYVLQGSVLRLHEQLRISAQLSEVASGHTIWAEQYNATAGEVVGVQESIVRAIAASTETQIVIAGRNILPPRQGELALQDLIARGFGLLYDEAAPALTEALALAEQAVAQAPKDWRGHALLAEAFVHGLAARVIPHDPAAVARALDLARNAVRMAHDNEWTHLVLARAYIEAGALDAAIAESERALEINPSSVTAIARLADCYALLGRSAEATEASRLALKLDPRGPETYRRHFTIGLAAFASADYAEAFRAAGRAARWRPDFVRAELLVAATATALGRKSEAEAALTRCRARYPDLRADEAAPRIMPPYEREADRARLQALLRQAGLP